MTKRRVVITDASVVTAAGIGKKDFFRNLSNGVSGIRPIQRFETSYLATKQGGEVNLSNLVLPPTIPGRKPWDRISDTKGVLAWNALLQISNSIPSDAAFFSAVGLERVSVDDLIKSIPRASMVCPEVPPTVLSGLLWRLLGLQGPVSTQVTACAAGTIAIGAAMRAIRRGRFECAVAGGVDSLIFPYGIHSFNSLDALSERNDLGPAALSPFDLNRSGTLLGEGAAYLVLEEASFA
ncbi:hypothetical protein HYY75_12080, partial [bacterium]|nr:hypothetical protein [bacterium]